MQNKSEHANNLLWVDLPLTPYREALQLQLEIVAAKRENRIGCDIILALEHPSVYTLGKRGGLENLVVTKAFLDRSDIEVVETDRGGNITYHGPGQLVIYPIVNLRESRLKVIEFVSGLEKVMTRTAACYGVTASGDPANRGAWLGKNKIGSIGIAVKKSISFHGIALNVNNDLTPFSWINPCGFNDISMTSIEKERDEPVSMVDVRKTARRCFETIFNMASTIIGKKELDELLAG